MRRGGAIQDLNIVNVDREKFKIIAYFEDGTILTNKNIYMDSFSEEEIIVHLHDKTGSYAGEVSFLPSMLKYNALNAGLYLDASDATLDYDTYSENDDERKAELIKKGLKIVVAQRITDDKLHYAV